MSQAAAYHASGAGSPRWVPGMLKFQRDTGVSGDELVDMFETWQAAPRPKPPMDKLWWSERNGGGRKWLDDHFGLGKAAKAPLSDAGEANELQALWESRHGKAANS